MSWFSSKSPEPTSFGYNITSSAGMPAELENMKGNIMKTSKKYRDELSKYREIAKFNQQISNSYIRNLEAMVDVSRVLNYYVEIFNILREEFERNDKLLGTSLKTADIGYLERLTKTKIDELNTKFMTESERLKKMYTAYGKNDELARINEAQNNLKATSEGAEAALDFVKTAENQAGGRRRGLPRFKPTPKVRISRPRPSNPPKKKNSEKVLKA